MSIQVDIVAVDRRIIKTEVDMVTLPGIDGQMGILHGHAPLLSLLDIGEIILHKGSDAQYIAVHGGVVEVRPDKVTILADTAESFTEIDEQRAQAARDRAQQLLANNPPPAQRVSIEMQLRKSNLRLKVARQRRTSALPSFEGDNR
jgi:F-type H+-transporting ATPase subunit epsilon